MNEIGYLIKELVRKKELPSTFPAIVSHNEFDTQSDPVDYVISVRILQDHESFQEVVKEVKLGKSNSEGLELHNVRLKASLQSEAGGLICIPKLGSWVMVSTVDNLVGKNFVSQYSELEGLLLNVQEETAQQEGEKKVSFVELKLNLQAFQLNFNNEFKAAVTKEQTTIQFVKPPTKDQGEEEEVLSDVIHTKDRMQYRYFEDKKVQSTVCFEKKKLVLKAKQEAHEIRISEEEGVLLKSDTKVRLEAKQLELVAGDDGEVQITGKSVAIKGSDSVKIN